MDVALLAARVVLALVFGVAGLAKLADRAGSRQALRDFGVPGWLASPVGLLLPLVELGVAVALLPAVSAWWGAVAATGLLLLFVLGMSITLLRGRRPACHCFGQLHSAPVGGPTLARNLVLAVVAAGVVLSGSSGVGVGPSAVAWVGGLAPGELAVLIGGLVALGLLAAEAWLLVQLVAQNGRLLLKLEALEARLDTGTPAPLGAPMPSAPAVSGLPVGSVAPDFSLPGLYGETLTLGALRAAGQPVLLMFMDPDCGPCNALLPEVGRWQREQTGQLTLAVVSRGTVEANLHKNAEHGISRVLLQQDREVAERYQAYGTPSAVLVQPDGRIGSPLSAGADAIRALVARSVGSPAEVGAVPLPMVPSAAPANGKCPHCGQDHGAAAAPVPLAGVQVGVPAPALQLPDLDGKTVDLAQFRGHPTLALFWNPGCGFCQQMLPDLQRWEASPPPGAPKLLMVSTGTAEANRAQGFRSPVLLDPNFSVGPRFGVNGTPSAVLVDAEGRIASQVGVGAPGVWALAGEAPSPPNGHTHVVAAPGS